ncbi:MAG: Holliday junction resolvase RuvX [Bacilli bacterium]|nr:Holliday junction resolvase RuvX [Bacilli bacterium]
MRYIGLDLGTKTLGVSISDKIGLIASFYKTIEFKDENYDSLIDPLKEIIDEYKIDKIVLGFPKNMNNSIGFAGERSLNFKKILENNFDLEVILEDERLSSVEANNIMIQGDLSRKKRKKKVDALAATIILQRYLDRKDR